MKIHHIAMYVNDLEGARSFFEKYLDASSNDLYHNKTTGFRSYFLSFSDGARLEIMNKPAMQVLSGPRLTGDGYYESCIAGFEGNQIEITV